MEILPYYWTPWLSIWCHQNTTNPSQKSHPAWLKKWLMAFPNCTSMAIPLAQKEVLYEKIMNNFSKTTVWKKTCNLLPFITFARLSWQGNIYFRLWLMYIHYNKTNVYLIIELCIALLLFLLPLFLSSSWDSTSNYEFRIKKTDW